MEVFVRFTLSLTVIAALTGGLVFWQPSWGESLGVDAWNLAKFRQIMRQEISRAEKLAEQAQRLREESRRKEEVVTELINDRITLPAAIDRVAELCGPTFVVEGIGLVGITDGDAREIGSEAGLHRRNFNAELTRDGRQRRQVHVDRQRPDRRQRAENHSQATVVGGGHRFAAGPDARRR